MSSRRRRSRGEQQDPFNTNTDAEVAPGNDLEAFSSLMYGEGDSHLAEQLRQAQQDARSMRIKFVPLRDVRPDPAQARRVMPVELRAAWLRQPQRVNKIILEWLDVSVKEAHRRGRPDLDITYELQRDPDDQGVLSEESDLPEPGPLEISFRAMLQLAASIHHHGLTNPITVAKDEVGYIVETGERRLLAYHLLHYLSQEEDFIEGKWDTIPCRLVESKNIWRQAAENGARQDLNAISMARQLALLLIEIYKEQGYEFMSYMEMPDVQWYAQVYDAKKFPVPYGRGSELAAAMGLKSANQLRQYRALLGLPNEVWQLADEQNWTENKIRNMMKQARKAISVRSVTTVTDVDENQVATDSESGESVTTVTDFDYYLRLLAQAELGELTTEELPTELREAPAPQSAESTEPAKPEPRFKFPPPKEPIQKTRRVSLLSGVMARLVEMNIDEGYVAFQLRDNPEVLEALVEGGMVILSVHRWVEGDDLPSPPPDYRPIE